MRYSIFFPQPIYIECRLHLLHELNRENMVICLSGLTQTSSELRFLVYHHEKVSTEAFDIHSGAFLQVKNSFFREKVIQAFNNNSHLIIWHSHPFTDIAQFSPTDDGNDTEQGKYLQKKIPRMYFIAMVAGQQNTLARIFSSDQCLQSINHIAVFGQNGLHNITNLSLEQKTCNQNRHNFITATALRLGRKVSGVLGK